MFYSTVTDMDFLLYYFVNNYICVWRMENALWNMVFEFDWLSGITRASHLYVKISWANSLIFQVFWIFNMQIHHFY